MSLDLRDPRVQKGMFGALLVCGLLYVNFFTTWAPFTYRANAAQVRKLEDQYRVMSKDLNKARQATHQLSYLEREYQLLHRKWEQSRALLPEDQDMAWLLRTLTVLGTRTGVEFTLFRPLPPKPAQYYTENPIEVAVVGGYHQVGAFLAEVANLDRIINVSNLELKELRDQGQDPTQTTSAAFVASTFTLGGTGQPPAGEPAAAGSQGKSGVAPGAAGAKPVRTAVPPGASPSPSPERGRPMSSGGGDE